MTEASLRDEALRLVSVADSAGIPLRVLGGVAFAILVPDWRGREDRPGRDLDVATSRTSRHRLTELLEENGYEADRRFNAANGHKQLYFVDTRRGRPLDVLIDRMEMCHMFDFRESLGSPGPTLSPADLLLSKLQVVELTHKDIVDALVLLSEFELIAHGDHGISVDRIVSICSNDWGWWRTLTANLDMIRGITAAETTEIDLGRPTKFDPLTQILEIRRAVDGAPKSVRWKVRSKVGDRVPWFDVPEEEAH